MLNNFNYIFNRFNSLSSQKHSFVKWWEMAIELFILCLDRMNLYKKIITKVSMKNLINSRFSKFGVHEFLYHISFFYKSLFFSSCYLILLFLICQEKEARKDEKLRFTCKCSFLEIYNEQILDLLDPSSTNLQVKITYISWGTIIYLLILS